MGTRFGYFAKEPSLLPYDDVEHREVIQDRNCVRPVALFTRAGTFLVGDKPVGENHGRAALAFADIAAHAQRLGER